MIDNILRLIELRSPSGAQFWFEGRGEARDIPLQDHADIIYSVNLLGRHDLIVGHRVNEFVDYLSGLSLYGRPKQNDAPDVGAHLTAYLLGAMRLLYEMQAAEAPSKLYVGWQKDALLDASDLPKWPGQWSHHIWRVSHWIGGSMSIVLHLVESASVEWADKAQLDRIFEACERHVLDRRTGQLKPYRSEILQKIFRLAYSLRHNPTLGDLGGVVHLLWIYHATARPYVGREWLGQTAEKELRRRPFMESMPYCLDFDIVQLARTANPHTDKNRAAEYANSISDYLLGEIASEYTLHKLPGALATLHECAFITGDHSVHSLGCERKDIIKTAFWI